MSKKKKVPWQTQFDLKFTAGRVRDGQMWYDGGPYATKEDAIHSYPGDAMLKPGTTFTVAPTSTFVPYLDASHALEQAACEAQDTIGEVAEDWLWHVDKRDEEALEEEINKVFHAWMEKRGYLPTYFHVDEDKRTEHTFDPKEGECTWAH